MNYLQIFCMALALSGLFNQATYASNYHLEYNGVNGSVDAFFTGTAAGNLISNVNFSSITVNGIGFYTCCDTFHSSDKINTGAFFGGGSGIVSFDGLQNNFSAQVAHYKYFSQFHQYLRGADTLTGTSADIPSAYSPNPGLYASVMPQNLIYNSSFTDNPLKLSGWKISDLTPVPLPSMFPLLLALFSGAFSIGVFKQSTHTCYDAYQ
ncbi:hypothetical protein HC024_03285 [Methylococcaceae bacterium WWC4]|nr:hypothetical protein [Methylococcaceae bacterium WWC4]